MENSRFLYINIPALQDVFFLTSFTGGEYLSTLFCFKLELLCKDHRVDLHRLLGQSITIGVKLNNPATYRYFNGIVSRCGQFSADGSFSRYWIEMVPSLHLLSLTSRSRIFQRKSTPEIVRQVLKEGGCTNVEWCLQSTYEPREFCVQYQETDLQFVMRLLEDEGIFFTFRHERDKHTMILSDESTHPQVGKSIPRVHYASESGQGVPREDSVIFAWQHEVQISHSHYAVSYFNPHTPERVVSLKAANLSPQHVPISASTTSYLGEGTQRTRAERLAKIRLEEHCAARSQVSGTSNVVTFSPGDHFELSECALPSLNRPYFLIGIEHRANDSTVYAGGPGQGAMYENRIWGLPSDISFRPQRVTPKPAILGSQTATIIGSSTGKVQTNASPEVQVRFPWDPDQQGSLPIRVAQDFAWKGSGSLFLPCVGQEVIVQFLNNGDPDHPLITGCLYNGTQSSPYDHPGKSHLRGFCFTSANGSGRIELTFDEEKGEIRIRTAGGSITLGPSSITIDGPTGSIVLDPLGVAISGPGGKVSLDPTGINIITTLLLILRGMPICLN